MGTSFALSVIVRTLGRPRLVEALESLARQSRRDVETVVVDMSRGAARGMVKPMAAHLHLRHFDPGRVLSRPEALNAGIRAASAPFISILDDDNLYESVHAEELIRGLEGSGADLVFTGARLETFTEDGVLVDAREDHAAYDFERLLFGNYIYASATAFRKSAWERVGGYDLRFPVYEDWDFLIRAGCAGRIVSVPGGGAVSRSFTGRPGVPEHHREALLCARCLAGLFWKHRRLYTRKLFLERKDLAGQYPHVPRHGWHRATLAHLAGWWWQGLARSRS